MIEIKCNECGTIGRMSLVDNYYIGPWRCWKCRSLFTIAIVGGQVKSSDPLSEEEFERMQREKAEKEQRGR